MIYVFLMVITVLIAVFYNSRQAADGIYLVHVICRHGEKRPEGDYPQYLWANASYYPGGFSQLTEEGKLRMYNLGVALKNRYHKFLDKHYLPWEIRARSSSYDRTQMAAQLILAGMFPPTPLESWNKNLNWQPIPVGSVPPNDDYIFLPVVACKKLAQLKDQTIQNIQGDIEYKKPFGEEAKECGSELPCWNQDPEVTKRLYEPFWSRLTEEMKKFAAGFLLKRIVEDTKNKINQNQFYKDMKFFLYSGHDINIIPMLQTLTVYNREPIPYGACLIVEIRKQRSRYFVEVFYQTNHEKETKVVHLSKCPDPCNFDDFVDAYKRYFAYASEC